MSIRCLTLCRHWVNDSSEGYFENIPQVPLVQMFTSKAHPHPFSVSNIQCGLQHIYCFEKKNNAQAEVIFLSHMWFLIVLHVWLGSWIPLSYYATSWCSRDVVLEREVHLKQTRVTEADSVVVVAGDELGQMFPNLPEAVTHRWPLMLCTVAWGK